MARVGAPHLSAPLKCSGERVCQNLYIRTRSGLPPRCPYRLCGRLGPRCSRKTLQSRARPLWVGLGERPSRQRSWCPLILLARALAREPVIDCDGCWTAAGSMSIQYCGIHSSSPVDFPLMVGMASECGFRFSLARLEHLVRQGFQWKHQWRRDEGVNTDVGRRRG